MVFHAQLGEDLIDVVRLDRPKVLVRAGELGHLVGGESVQHDHDECDAPLDGAGDLRDVRLASAWTSDDEDVPRPRRIAKVAESAWTGRSDGTDQTAPDAALQLMRRSAGSDIAAGARRGDAAAG